MLPTAVLLPRDNPCYTFRVLNFSAHYLPITKWQYDPIAALNHKSSTLSIDFHLVKKV